MTGSENANKLVHSQLVEVALTQPLRDFLLLYDEWPMLVLAIPTDDPAFEQDLRAADSAVGGLAYRTEPLPWTKVPPRPYGGGATRTQTCSAALSELLRGQRGFAALVRKREGASSPYPDRVSVGRARNQDLVLRHSSVSKFHAYFEVSQGVWHLTDGGSTNLTYLNGTALVPRTKATIAAGDQVRFGSISCLVCEAEDLWKFIRS
jgi:hypothetical protein